jgi:hypothetical protein
MAEPESTAAVVQGVLLFLTLLATGLPVGLGLLALLRLPADPFRRLLLAPYAATLFWALSGTLLVRLGASTRVAAPWIIGASVVLAVAGVVDFWRARRRLVSTAVVGYVTSLLILFALTTLPYFQRGLAAHLGSPNLDTVNYTNVAATMWRYGIDLPPDVPLYFERLRPFVNAFGEARNNTYILLGLFSVLVDPGEPLFVRNLFVCWSLLVLVFTLAFFRTTWKGFDTARPARIHLLYVVLTVGVGWAAIPALVGNWDNALLVSLGPALAGLAAEPARRWSQALLLGASLAFAAYTYTELAPLATIFCLPWFVRSLIRAPDRRLIAVRYLAAIAVALILLAPGASGLWKFFDRQRAAAAKPTVVLRPGGRFAGGLVQRAGDPAAWWALGAEHGFPPRLPGRSASIVLTGLSLVGVIHLARRKRYAELASLGLVALSVGYFVFVDRYAYATYKILSVSWWIVGLNVAEGFTVAFLAGGGSSVTPMRLRTRPVFGAALVLLVLASLTASSGYRTTDYFSRAIFVRQPTIPALVRLKDRARGQPATDTFVPDSTGDGLLAPWIFYALKEGDLRLYHGPGAKPPVPGGGPWPNRNAVPATTLLPASGLNGTASVRFRTPEFALVDSASVVIIERIDSPNGHEPWGTWLGTKPITVTFWAPAGREALLTFDAAAGPSLPERLRRRLTIGSNSGQSRQLEFDKAGTIAFPFVTAGGQEVLTLSTSDAPTVAVLPNGDIRPLLVRVTHLAVSFRRAMP